MRQNRDPGLESGDNGIADSIRQMREPPGALGDIVRRMKRRAVLERSTPSSVLVGDAGLMAG